MEEWSYELVLSSTGEPLDIRAYNATNVLLEKRPAWLKSGSDCILVARGGSLLEPVIISRRQAWPLGLLKAWKGKQGLH